MDPKAEEALTRTYEAFTGRDDPYAPYWPGADAVDWVGMSLYHWGSAHPWGENEVPEPGKFAGWIAPPKVGIDNKPGDFEYVKIAA